MVVANRITIPSGVNTSPEFRPRAARLGATFGPATPSRWLAQGTPKVLTRRGVPCSQHSLLQFASPKVEAMALAARAFIYLWVAFCSSTVPVRKVDDAPREISDCTPAIEYAWLQEAGTRIFRPVMWAQCC